MYPGFTNCIPKTSKNISGDHDSVGTDKFYTLPEKTMYDKSLNNTD
jgi:hypothetical protein